MNCIYQCRSGHGKGPVSWLISCRHWVFAIGVNQGVTDKNAVSFGQAAVCSESVPAATVITRVKDTEIRGGKRQATADFHLLS